MKYYLKTPFGIFFISSAPYGGYNLNLEEDTINWSNSAEELAQQVFERTSGFEEWDKATNLEAPKNLEEWQVKI
ncbi:MAG: hypothetical protein WBF48_03680 [Halarcobacter sp.]